MAIRNIESDQDEKLLILDTEGLCAVEKGKRLSGKDVDFDRCMALFCLTVSNAMMITLKGEIDSETVEIINVCCWALQNLKINKMSTPHIFFILNQQTQSNVDNLREQLRKVIKKIIENPMYADDNILEHIAISEDNFFILPSAFNQETRNYEKLFEGVENNV